MDNLNNYGCWNFSFRRDAQYAKFYQVTSLEQCLKIIADTSIALGKEDSRREIQIALGVKTDY